MNWIWENNKIQSYVYITLKVFHTKLQASLYFNNKYFYNFNNKYFSQKWDFLYIIVKWLSGLTKEAIILQLYLISNLYSYLLNVLQSFTAGQIDNYLFNGMILVVMGLKAF